MSRLQGVIKFVNAEKGFGFIDVAGSKEQYYFRLTSVAVPKEISLSSVGTGVEFSVAEDPRNPGKRLAVSVNIIDAAGKEDTRKHLVSFLQKRRAEVEPPELNLNDRHLGRIVKVMPDKGFGFVLLQCGYRAFFHSSAVVVPLNSNGKIGSGVQVVLKPSEKKEGAYDVAELVILDEAGEEPLLKDITSLVGAKRERDLRGAERREDKFREKDSEKMFDGLTKKQRVQTVTTMAKAFEKAVT